MKKYFKRILSFVLALAIVLTMISLPKASTDIKVTIQNTPKMDIILTSKDTNLDLSNFENDLKTKLQKENINISDITFKTIERVTSEFDQNNYSATEIYNSWKMCPQPNSTIVIGDYIVNSSSSGSGQASQWAYNQIFTYEDSKNSSYIEFETELLNHGCCAPSGLVVNYDETTDVGYVILIGDDAKVSGGASWGAYEQSIILVKISNFNETFNRYWNDYGAFIPYSTGGIGKYEVLKSIPTTSVSFLSTCNKTTAGKTWYNSYPNQWHKLKVIIDENGLMNFYIENNLAITYNFGKENHNGCVGLMFQCDAAFRDVKITTKKDNIKTFKEVLTEPTWRDDAEHIVVNVDNNIDDTLTSTSTIGEILSRTLADDIHFIQWGTDTNKSATTNFIKQNDNKGLFTYNSDYEQAIENTVNYIKELIGQQQSSEDQYITIGQELNLLVTPQGFEKNAISDKYPNGRWKINHDYKYFANNLGQSSESGMYMSNLNCNFDKPGKYEITFDDEIVKTVYVHRKPVSDFEISIENLQITLNSVSYDLDSNKNNGYGKGIVSEKWYYKEVSESIWHEGKLEELDKENIYVIKLEVTDEQGISNYTTKYVGTGNPVSKFNFMNDTVCKYNKLEINNTSYDPEGRDIKSESWTLKKDGQVIGIYSEPILDFNTSDLGSGKYSYTLIVTNSADTISEAYTKTFTIVDDTVSPEIIVDTNVNNEWIPEKEMDIEVSDNESNVAKW